MTEREKHLLRSARACGAAGLLALALAASSAPAHEDHAGHKTMVVRGTQGIDQTEVQLLDLPLIDKEGQPHLFRSEVIGDRIVAVNFIYTSCTTVCPVISAIFAEVQNRLGERLGPEVRLVSLSIDPATDAPRRLKSYAEGFGAGPGWTFLTGDTSRMTKVLAGLGAFTPEFEEHAPMVLVGDAGRNVWRRFYGFASPDDIVAEIEGLIAWRQDHHNEKEHTQ